MKKLGLTSVILAGLLAVSSAAYAQAKIKNKINTLFFSDWVMFESQTNDGRPVFQAQVPAEDPVIDTDGTKRKLLFIIECRGTESTAAFLLQGSALTITSESTVIQLKADREDEQEIVFHQAANKKALIIRDNTAAINFIQSLYDKTQLKMSAGLSSPATVRAEFDINRVETAAEPIAKACNWPPKQ